MPTECKCFIFYIKIDDEEDFDLIMRPSGTEIDLHGMQVEDALYQLDLFLDRAVRDALYTVWIIHGKGQGILRNEIARHLKGHPLVKSYGLADHHHGGPGVTRVELDW